jgi:hypothetical protein
VKRSTVVNLIVVLIVLAIAWQAYRYRIRIETWIWHARHGPALTVGNYVFPVWANWYVKNVGEGNFLLGRLDTEDHTPLKKLKQNASIMFSSRIPVKEEGLKRVLAVQADFLKKQGVDPIQQKNFSMGDETIYCTGAEWMPSPPDIPDVFDVQPVAWTCMSPGGLDLGVIGIEPDLQQSWEIVGHIHKKS